MPPLGRLDDTFRGYLAERGAKKVPLAEVTALVTGVAGLRLAADAVIDLRSSATAVVPGSPTTARRRAPRVARLGRASHRLV